ERLGRGVEAPLEVIDAEHVERLRPRARGNKPVDGRPRREDASRARGQRPRVPALGIARAARERSTPAHAYEQGLAAELAVLAELGHGLAAALVGELWRDLAVRIRRAREETPAPARADDHGRTALGAGLVRLLGDLRRALLVDGERLRALVLGVVAGA